MIYHQVKEVAREEEVSISGVLSKLGLSKSGYYSFINREESKQKRRKRELSLEISQIHRESNEIYGAPKITQLLKRKGYDVSEKYVGNIMRELGIKAHYIKPYTKTTKDCDFSSQLKNVLNRDFSPNAPNAAWSSDITYVWTQEDGFVYLTSIMDLYSRKIISWTLSRSMQVDEVLKCLDTAKEQRDLENPIDIHSDRGSQYTSAKYKELTAGMVTSYSDKGNPWDNACIEAFHAVIKREWLYRFTPDNYEHAYQLIFEYIEGFYNTNRIHSHCDYLSPNEYEKNAFSEKVA